MSQTDRVNYGVKIAVIVRALRKAMVLNQGELCAGAECSRQTLNRIESFDKSSPRGDTVDSIIKVFNKMGVEVQINDESVSIKFTKESLLNAEKQLTKRWRKNVTNKLGFEGSKAEMDHTA